MCFSQFLIPINSCFLHQDRFFLHVSRIFLLLGSLPRFSYMDLSFSFWNTQNVMSLWPSCCSYQMEIHITHSGSLINITRARTSFFFIKKKKKKKSDSRERCIIRPSKRGVSSSIYTYKIPLLLLLLLRHIKVPYRSAPSPGPNSPRRRQFPFIMGATRKDPFPHVLLLHR